MCSAQMTKIENIENNSTLRYTCLNFSFDECDAIMYYILHAKGICNLHPDIM